MPYRLQQNIYQSKKKRGKKTIRFHMKTLILMLVKQVRCLTGFSRTSINPEHTKVKFDESYLVEII